MIEVPHVCRDHDCQSSCERRDARRLLPLVFDQNLSGRMAAGSAPAAQDHMALQSAQRPWRNATTQR